VRKTFQLLLSIAVLAVFSGVAFVNFYRLNLDSLAEPSRLVACYLMLLAAAIGVSLIARAVLRNAALARIVLVAAVVTFMMFYYAEIKRLIGGDRPALSILCWACVTLLLAFVVGKFSGRKAFPPTMAIVGVIYMVPAAAGLIQARLHYPKLGNPVALPLTARNAVNVYWIVLDGYPRPTCSSSSSISTTRRSWTACATLISPCTTMRSRVSRRPGSRSPAHCRSGFWSTRRDRRTRLRRCGIRPGGFAGETSWSAPCARWVIAISISRTAMTT
jgi:hypothetical protein